MGRSMINEHKVVTESIYKRLEFKIARPTLSSVCYLCVLDCRLIYDTPTTEIFYISGLQTGFLNLADKQNVSGVLR
jgi:hypothetical protein